jgi:hypothetical protein
LNKDFLFKLTWNKRRGKNTEEQFVLRILEMAAGMIASKILNPKRKGLDIWYYQKLLEQLFKKRLVGHAKTRRDTARAIIKIHEWITKRNRGQVHLGRFPSSLFKMDDTCYHEITRSIGHILGFSLYSRVMGHSASTEDLRRIFSPGAFIGANFLDDFYHFYSYIMHNE